MNCRHAGTNGRSIVLAEKSDRFEVRRQTDSPTIFSSTLRWVSRSSRRLDWTAIELAVEVDLQRCRWVISRPACRLWLHSGETQLTHIKFLDENVDHSNRKFSLVT